MSSVKKSKTRAGQRGVVWMIKSARPSKPTTQVALPPRYWNRGISVTWRGTMWDIFASSDTRRTVRKW